MPPIFTTVKAYITLVGSVATALLAVFAGTTTVGQILTVVSIIATTIGMYKAPYQPAAGVRRARR